MKIIAAAASLVFAVITASLVALAVARASLPYENGRYFDPVDSVVYHDSAAAVYGLLAAIFAMVTAFAVWGTVRLWKRSPS